LLKGYDEGEEDEVVRTEIDWTTCELIEQIPGKVSGHPVVRGTRILPDAIVDSMTWARASTSYAKASPPCPSNRSSG
jgi:hypothetical protein